MEVVNPFILKNKERMVVFLDHLSSVRDKPYPDEDRVKVAITLHYVVQIKDGLHYFYQLITDSLSLHKLSVSPSG